MVLDPNEFELIEQADIDALPQEQQDEAKKHNEYGLVEPDRSDLHLQMSYAMANVQTLISAS